MDKTTVVSVKVISFLSLFMLLTLNAANGKDFLDVGVAYIEAKTQEAKSDNPCEGLVVSPCTPTEGPYSVPVPTTWLLLIIGIAVLLRMKR